MTKELTAQYLAIASEFIDAQYLEDLSEYSGIYSNYEFSKAVAELNWLEQHSEHLESVFAIRRLQNKLIAFKEYPEYLEDILEAYMSERYLLIDLNTTSLADYIASTQWYQDIYEHIENLKLKPSEIRASFLYNFDNWVIEGDQALFMMDEHNGYYNKYYIKPMFENAKMMRKEVASKLLNK